MKEKTSISLESLFEGFKDNEEFNKESRRLKPYYDLVVQIINRRNELGFTQKDLAGKANTHQSRISKIESAELDIRLSTLIQIAEALQTEVTIKLTPINAPIPVDGNEIVFSPFTKSALGIGESSSQYNTDETGANVPKNE